CVKGYENKCISCQHPLMTIDPNQFCVSRTKNHAYVKLINYIQNVISLAELVFNPVQTAQPVWHQTIDFIQKEAVFVANTISKLMDNRIVFHVNGHVILALILIVVKLALLTLIEQSIMLVIMIIIVTRIIIINFQACINTCLTCVDTTDTQQSVDQLQLYVHPEIL
ncbi:hypothetical protein pb186bvf_021103, partial [Paramecium bursaria]